MTKKLIVLILMILLGYQVNASANNCTSVYQVTSIQLNIRDQASIKGNIVGILNKGDQVCIEQEYGKWGKTNNGWVSKKHLQIIDISNQNPVQSVNASNTQSSDDDVRNGAVILGTLIVLAFIFFGLKTLFYHILISLGMAEPDGRAKNGIRLTQLGKFMASISGLIILFIIMLIGSTSK